MSIIPSKQQLAFLDDEVGVFFHYGIRTFNEEHRDWDMKPMSPSSFNPSEQDCESWIRQLKEAGVKYTVLTSKHHDGFAIWQTEQTEYSIKNSPYKNGKGDVVDEYVKACRKYGMTVGIYYSCAQFGSDKMTDGDYNRFVMNQLTELLTNYGKIDYMWFDGCGSDGHSFEVEKIVSLIYTLQPEINVFGSWGANIRWIGNEWGAAPLNNDNAANGVFMPGECDCCITRNGRENFWFYNETNREYVRTPDEMVGLYCNSVGRGANLLINIAPDRRGLLPEENVKLISDMMKEVKRIQTECVLPATAPAKNGNGEYVITLERFSLVDTVIIEEDMTEGQHVKSFEISVSQTDSEDSRVSVYSGYTVGHKRICTFPTIRARKIMLRVCSDGNAKISKITPIYAAGKQQIKG